MSYHTSKISAQDYNKLDHDEPENEDGEEDVGGDDGAKDSRDRKEERVMGTEKYEDNIGSNIDNDDQLFMSDEMDLFINSMSMSCKPDSPSSSHGQSQSLSRDLDACLWYVDADFSGSAV